MAIMLNGVEYPKMDTGIVVPIPKKPKEEEPDKLWTGKPSLPLKIDDKPPEINIKPGYPNDNSDMRPISVSGEKIDSKIEIWKPAQTSEIDNGVSVPNISAEVTFDSLGLRINNTLEDYGLPTIKGLGSDPLIWGINYGLNLAGVKSIPNYNVRDIVDTYVPDLSEYNIYLKNIQRGDQYYKDYVSDFQGILNSFTDGIQKALTNIVDKVDQIADVLKGGSGLDQGLPKGYTYTINNGKMRWEAIDWMKVDPILASTGIIKPGINTRPDLLLNQLGLDKKGAKEPLVPKGFISIGGQNVNWGNVSWYTLTNGFNYAGAPTKTVQNGSSIDTIYYFDYPLDSKHVIWDVPDPQSIRDPRPSNAANVKPYFEKHFTNPEFRNRSMEFLMSSGADLINNQFDIAFVLTLPENNKEIMEIVDNGLPICNDIYWKHVVNGVSTLNSLLMVRISSINVPQLENESFTFKWLNQNITKVRSKVKYERRAELKMLLDEPLYMRLLLNLLSGTSRAGKLPVGNDLNFNYRPKNLYPGNVTLSYNINILIKHEALLNYPYLNSLKETWRKVYNNQEETGYAGSRPAEMPIWWFQDVRFLGEGSDLTFDRDGTGVTELTYPFIFSRCIKFDRSTKFTTGEVKNPFTDVSVVDGNLVVEDSPNLADITMNQGNQNWMKSNSFWSASL